MLKHDLEDFLHKKIPATALLDFKVFSVDDTQLIMEAPLHINHNDKGTGFGGSIEALAIITGWSVTWTLLKQTHHEANVVIKSSQSSFIAPVKSNFQARCHLPDKEEIASLWERFTCKGKARLSLHVKVFSEETLCMELHAQYVFLHT